MPVLWSTVILVGVIALLDLLLTFGVIRRLREHNELLTSRLGRGAGMSSGLPNVGGRVAPFTATTVDGEVVTAADLTGSALIAVFSTSCAPCRDKLPGFVAAAAAHPGGPQRVLAVVVGLGEEATTFLNALSSVARVVREKDHGAVSTALGVSAFPTFVLVDAGGFVGAAAHDLSRLPIPTPR